MVAERASYTMMHLFFSSPRPPFPLPSKFSTVNRHFAVRKHEYHICFYTFIPHIIPAKEKLRKQRIHESGGGERPAKLTTFEQAIKKVLGDTPTFVGVVGKDGDSTITITKNANNNDLQAKVCGATRTDSASGIGRALNSGTCMNKYF